MQSTKRSPSRLLIGRKRRLVSRNPSEDENACEAGISSKVAKEVKAHKGKGKGAEKPSSSLKGIKKGQALLIQP